jgi:hypothetical protein
LKNLLKYIRPVSLALTEARGQYGVSISDSTGALGEYRHLLFDCTSTESDDPFGNSFYSEINVLGPGELGGK